MAANPTLVVALEARLDRFEKQLVEAGKIAERAVAQVEEKFSKANPTMKGLENLIPKALIVAALYGIKQLIDALGELGDRSQDLRLPVEQLQAMSMAATENRVRADELGAALDKFNQVSKGTTETSKEFYKALGNIGAAFVVSFKGAQSQSERLAILSQAMASTNDEVKRAQLGLTAFGSDSERVTGFIAKLNSETITMAQRAREMGIQIDAAMVKAGQEASTQLSFLAQVIGNQLLAAIAKALPTLIALVPVLEKVGRAILDTLSGIVEREARPTGTLERELEGFVSATEKAQKDLKALENEPAGFVFRRTREAIDADIKDISDKINFFQSEMGRLRGIIGQRQATEQDRQEGSNRGGAALPPAFKPRPSLKDDAEGGKDAFDRQAASIEKHTAAVRADTEAVGETVGEQAGWRAEMLLFEAAARSNIEVNDALIARIKEVGDAAADAADKQKKASELLSSFKSFGADLSSGFQAAVFEGKKLNDVIKDMLKSLASRQLNKLFEILSTQAFNSFSNFGGPRAGGGPVDPGRTYLIGERGPELFRPGASGMVIPNGLSGGGSPRLNLIINNNAGADVSAGSATPDGSGGFNLQVFVDKIKGDVAGDIADKRGAIGSALRGAHGLRPVMRRR